MALICANTAYKYNELMELEFIYYKDLLTEVGLKLQYSAIVNILGRDYSDEKIFKFVDEASPINIDHTVEIENVDKKEETEKLTIKKLKEVGLLK